MRNEEAVGNAVDLTGVCKDCDLKQVIELVDKLKQILEIFEPSKQAEANWLPDLISGGRLQDILDFLQKVDIDRLLQIIRIVNNILERFNASSSSSTGQEMTRELQKLRVNVRGMGGIRDLLRIARELQAIVDCLREANLLEESN
jgi:hypothetical protein